MAQQEDVRQEVKITINDLIYTQVQDLGKRMDRLENRIDKLEERLDTTRRELNARMDKIDARMDKIDERIDKLADKIEKLADKIDAHHAELKASTSHISIANISTVGIALGVLYTLFFK